jgi:hypothetical protein
MHAHAHTHTHTNTHTHTHLGVLSANDTEELVAELDGCRAKGACSAALLLVLA